MRENYFLRNIKNKRGSTGEEILSPWMFGVWFIVAIAVLVGIAMLNSLKIDARGLEAEIMVSKIISCGVEAGEIQDYMLDERIFERCFLDLESVDAKLGNYYFEIKMYETEGCSKDWSECNLLLHKEYGNKEVKQECEITSGKKAEGYGKCSWNVIRAEKDGKERAIYVYAGSKQAVGT